MSLNFTADSTAVNNIYYDITGDPTRRAGMLDIEYLLAKDVTVGLMYGDRDYRYVAQAIPVFFVVDIL